MGRSGIARLAALASVAALAISACGGNAATTAPSAAPTTAATATAATATAAPTTVPSTLKSGTKTADGHVIVRWFVGLGSGTNPNQITLQQQVVSDFNALQDKRTDGKDKILLSLEIVQNNTATDILKTEIASGNAPDLIGPVGIKGRAGFAGEFLDMGPLIKTAGFDTSVYSESLLGTMKDGTTGALLGIPYGVYPSYIFYNKDLFDEAGLKYPPTKVGDKYTLDGAQVDWNWDTVRKVAMKLAVDKSGKDATEAGFDPANQTQYGFEFQWTEGRRLASAFGSGSLVAADGKTAQFPDAWKIGWKWYYDGIWKDHFIATDAERNSDLLAKGNVISSGHVGMAHMFQWYVCCISPAVDKVNPAIKHWDIAPMPANSQGVTTAPINIDTFTIDKGSAVPNQAFEAMTYIMTRMDLLALYGGTPATGDQLAYYHKNVDAPFAKQFPGNKVNWQVALDMENYTDSPNHEAEMPNYIKAMSDYTKVFTTLATTKDLDMDAQITAMVATLQADFNAGS
jgi:multiple sugar transport system substrate-binding protein